MSDESNNAAMIATLVLLAGGTLFLAAPYLVTKASQKSFQDRYACEPVSLPVLPSEPDKLAALVVEVERAPRGEECALRRHRMTDLDLAAALEHLQGHPERKTIFDAELVRLRALPPAPDPVE